MHYHKVKYGKDRKSALLFVDRHLYLLPKITAAARSFQNKCFFILSLIRFPIALLRPNIFHFKHHGVFL